MVLLPFYFLFATDHELSYTVAQLQNDEETSANKIKTQDFLNQDVSQISPFLTGDIVSMVLESSIGTLTFIPEAYLQYLDQNQFLTA